MAQQDLMPWERAALDAQPTPELMPWERASQEQQSEMMPWDKAASEVSASQGAPDSVKLPNTAPELLRRPENAPTYDAGVSSTSIVEGAQKATQALTEASPEQTYGNARISVSEARRLYPDYFSIYNDEEVQQELERQDLRHLKPYFKGNDEEYADIYGAYPNGGLRVNKDAPVPLEAVKPKGIAGEGFEETVSSTQAMIKNEVQKRLESNPDLTYKEAMDETLSEMRGDVVEFATDIGLTILTGGFGLTGSLARRVGVQAATGAATAVAGGAAGNVAADRDLDEGLYADLLIGGGAGTLGGLLSKTGAKKVSETIDTAKVISAERKSINEQMKNIDVAAKIDEVADDLAKAVDGTNPNQVSRIANAIPDGEVKDQLKNLHATGFGPAAKTKRQEAQAFFEDPDNIVVLRDYAYNIKGSAEDALSSVNSEYSALSALMNQGKGGRRSVDISYLDEYNDIISKGARSFEETVGFGIPSELRKRYFKEAQVSTRNKASEKISDFISESRKKLESGSVKGSQAKGIRSSIEELTDVAEALDKGKDFKYDDVAQNWNYLPKSLQDSLMDVASVQQYSAKFSKGVSEKSVTESIRDYAGKTIKPTLLQGGIAVATGGASVPYQAAAGVLTPLIRNWKQSGNKAVIAAAGNVSKALDDMDAAVASLSKAHNGNRDAKERAVLEATAALEKELDKLRPDQARELKKALAASSLGKQDFE